MSDDLISRSAMLKSLDGLVTTDDMFGMGISQGIGFSIERISKAPAVDAVIPVLCKDCKHWLKDVPGCTDFVGRCELANYMVGATGYCVYGDRRADDE